MSDNDIGRGSWLRAIVVAVFFGIAVAIGSIGIVLFYASSSGSATPLSTIYFWTCMFGALVGIAVAGYVLWLYHAHEIDVRSIKRAIGDFLHELGGEPF